MSAPGQLDFGALLERAGATPPRYGRGKWGCPECGRPGRVSVDFGKEAYKCWHAGCGFQGYRATLEKRLGLSRKLTPSEQCEQRRVFGESERAAEWLAGKLRARRFELYDAHQSLLSILFGASDGLRRNAAHESAWAALAYAYPELEGARAELALLENAPIADRLAFLQATPQARKAMLRQIIERGGLSDRQGRFIEVEIHSPGAVVA